jgi:hypothetical protein
MSANQPTPQSRGAEGAWDYLAAPPVTVGPRVEVPDA